MIYHRLKTPHGKSVWGGKPAAIISGSPGNISAFGANHHLRQSLVFLDMPTLQQPEAYLAHVDKMLDESGKLVPDTAKFLGDFLKAFDRAAGVAFYFVTSIWPRMISHMNKLYFVQVSDLT